MSEETEIRLEAATDASVAQTAACRDLIETTTQDLIDTNQRLDAHDVALEEKSTKTHSHSLEELDLGDIPTVASDSIYEDRSDQLATSKAVYTLTRITDDKADLVNGLVPTSQLPGYVSTIIEHATFDDFPTTGLDNTIYYAQDTSKTYRWSGTSYVIIGSDLSLGETASTAYRGDRGKIAFDHTNETHVALDHAHVDYLPITGGDVESINITDGEKITFNNTSEITELDDTGNLVIRAGIKHDTIDGQDHATEDGAPISVVLDTTGRVVSKLSIKMHDAGIASDDVAAYKDVLVLNGDGTLEGTVLATNQEGIDGSQDDKLMTPASTTAAIANQLATALTDSKASDAEAINPAVNDKYVTPRGVGLATAEVVNPLLNAKADLVGGKLPNSQLPTTAESRLDTLESELNAAEATITSLQSQIASAGATSSKGSTSSIGSWSITGLVAYKPLYISFGGNSTNGVFIMTSGTTTNGRGYMIANGPVCTIIPTGSTVVLQVSALGDNLLAHQ